MAQRKNNTPGQAKQPPKSGYGFLEALLKTLQGLSGPLAAELEKNHQRHGRRGYPAKAMLTVFALQYLLNQRFNSYLLAELDDRPPVLRMCGLDHAPSEPTFCRFKRKLAQHLELLAPILDRVIEECGEEIERLRDLGIVPKEAPRLGDLLALDPTDIETYARPRSEHCDAPEPANCSRQHRSHCNSLNRDECTRHGRTPCRDPNARWGYRTPKGKFGGARAKDGEDRKEWFFGYKAHVMADGYFQIPLHMALRPANENEAPKFTEDLDATLARHPWLRRRYVLADKGL